MDWDLIRDRTGSEEADLLFDEWEPELSWE